MMLLLSYVHHLTVYMCFYALAKGTFSFCDVLNIVAVNSAKYVTKVTLFS